MPHEFWDLSWAEFNSISEHKEFIRKESWRQTASLLSLMYNAWRNPKKSHPKAPKDLVPMAFDNLKNYREPMTEKQAEINFNRAVNRMYKVFPKQSLN